MASAREKLIRCNQANEKNRGNTSSDNTIFGDFANREDENTAQIEAKETKNIKVKESEPLKVTPEDKTVVTPESAAITQEAPEQKQYSGKNIMISLGLSYEHDRYLLRKSIALGTSIKQVYKDIMIGEIARSVNGSPEGELAEQYRRTQHPQVRKTIMIEEGLKTEINATAQKYYMRPAAFSAYAIEVALRTDGNLYM